MATEERCRELEIKQAVLESTLDSIKSELISIKSVIIKFGFLLTLVNVLGEKALKVLDVIDKF